MPGPAPGGRHFGKYVFYCAQIQHSPPLVAGVRVGILCSSFLLYRFPMNTHAYTLNQGALLTLCADDDTSGQPLSTALRQAQQQGCHHIWIDCRHTPTLPAPLLHLLRRYAARLWQAGSYLLLCHLSPLSRAALAGCATLPLAAAPLDADLYGLSCPAPPAAS